MASKRLRVDTRKGAAFEEDMPEMLALREQVEKIQQEMHALMDKQALHDLLLGLPNVKLMITYGGHWVDDTYKGECASNEILGTFQQMQQSVKNAVGPLSFAKDIVIVVSDHDASDQIENDVEEDDTVDWNDELHDDFEDDYASKHDGCSEDDREDVKGVDPIYDNAIALENNIRSLDDSDQERVNTEVSYQWIIPEAELKRALSMLALKEHFEFRVEKSCHARFEVGCKEKACKFSLCATKLLEGEYWQLRTLADFNKHMNQLKQLCKPVYDCLMRLGPKRWAHAQSLTRRYKLLTSNIVECINSCLRHARKMPIMVLIECIRGMFQCWFHDRHNEALNLTMPLSP
ncbi:Uncharacterized protein TCM_033005 [Theobroma cacao]|uniref:Transposase MuDR plant domain-containing protein n=1 Tax=Theobroma cacao TaxID=3641 RepID=A0A061FHP3_THECC|nr:Uncharacterized protein TCM_033005 [Theobroma cacao]